MTETSSQQEKRLTPAQLGGYDLVSIGSLTQEDPIGLAGGLNLYGFASGDPVNFADPFGLSPQDCRKVKCPTILQIAMNQAVYSAGFAMLEASQKDRRERMAYLFNGPNGSIRVGEVYVGGVGGVRAGTDAPPPPDDAIGSIHTHPDETKGPSPVPGGVPSGDDLDFAANYHINGVVESVPYQYFVRWNDQSEAKQARSKEDQERLHSALEARPQ